MHRLFAELLAQGRLSRSARKKVSAVYEEIKESADFEPLEHDAKATGANPQNAPRPGPAAPSARHAGGQPGNDLLRSLFRRLTLALHPDRTQHEGEQKRRTVVMMEVTRAYEEGDYARLIEIEQQWMAGGHADSATHDDAAKRVALERGIKELRLQLKAITGELKSVRMSSPLRALFGKQGRRRSNTQGPIDAMVSAANEDLKRMRIMRDFIRSFSESKISLAQFMRGPDSLRPDEFDEEFDFVRNAIDSLLDDFEVVPVNPRKAPRSRRKPKGSSVGDDVPF